MSRMFAIKNMTRILPHPECPSRPRESANTVINENITPRVKMTIEMYFLLFIDLSTRLDGQIVLLSSYFINCSTRLSPTL